MELAQPAGRQPLTRKEYFALLWSLRPVRRTFVELTLLTGIVLLFSAIVLSTPPFSRWQTISVWLMAPLVVFYGFGVPIVAGALAYGLGDVRCQPKTCLIVLTSSLGAVAAYTWFILAKGDAFFGWKIDVEHSRFSMSLLPIALLGQAGCLGLALAAVLFRPALFRVNRLHRSSNAIAAGCGLLFVLNSVSETPRSAEAIFLLIGRLPLNLMLGLMLDYFLAKIGGECVIAYRERRAHGSASATE